MGLLGRRGQPSPAHAVRGDDDRAPGGGEPSHLRGLVDDLPDAVVVLDARMRCLDINETAVRLDGRPRAELLGTRFRDVGPHASDRFLREAGAREVLADGTASTRDYEAVHDGAVRRYELRAVRGPTVDDAPTALVVTRDVTEQHAAWEVLAFQAFHDELTGLTNRAGLMAELDRLVDREPPARFALLQVDVDNLKVVNDAHGHGAGDALLIAIAGRLSATIREGDVLARFGGDEFVVVAQRVSDAASAAKVADRIREGVRMASLDGIRPASVSVGITLAEGGERSVDLLRRADAAMYLAKERGRDRHEHFDSALHDRVTTRRILEEALRDESEGSSQG